MIIIGFFLLSLGIFFIFMVLITLLGYFFQYSLFKFFRAKKISLTIFLESFGVGTVVFIFYSYFIIDFVRVFNLFTIYFPLTFEIIMRKTQKKFSGGVIGAYEATFGIGWAAGPLFAGIVSDYFGKDAPYFAFFVIGIIVTLILIINRKKLQLEWNTNL